MIIVVTNQKFRFAYAYTIRTLSQSSLNGEETDPAAALAMFQQLLPFLVEKSTVMLSDISEGIEYVISREKADVRFYVFDCWTSD